MTTRFRPFTSLALLAACTLSTQAAIAGQSMEGHMMDMDEESMRTMMPPGHGSMDSGMMGPGMMMGSGMMDHMGMMMGRPNTLNQTLKGIGALDLNPQQQDQIRSTLQALRSSRLKLLGQLVAAQDGIYQAYSKEQPDPQEVRQAYEKISDLRLQMIEEKIKARNRIYNTLTTEQQQQLQQIRPSHGKRMMR